MNNSESALTSVKSVRATDGGRHLVLAIECCDGGEALRETLTLCTARLTATPCVGVIDAETLSYYRREHQVARALAMGLRSLSAADCSKEELRRKLRAKGVARDVADEVIEELERRGLFREVEAGIREAERGMAKLWGYRRIMLHMQSKGYSNEALGAAHHLVLSQDGTARCRRLLQKRHITCLPADKREADKIIAMLMRYGYNTKEIKAALEPEE